MAAQLAGAGVVVAVVARILVGGLEHPFLQAYQAVDQLEHGPRGIGGHHGAVEHGLARVAGEAVVVAAYVGQHVHVDSRARHHREYLPGRGFDCHHRTDLPRHELLPVLLQVGVYGGDDVLSGHRGLVLPAVEVGRLHPVPGVPEHYVVALLPAELLLHRGLEAGASDVVARLVFARMVLDVVGVDLGYVAQQIASGVEGIVPDAAGLRAEAGEEILLLGELHVDFRRHLLEQGHGAVAYAAAVFAVVGHPVADEGDGRVEGTGELECVEFGHVPRGHEYVVADGVAHQNLAVAVVDHPSGRVDVGVDHGVVGRVLLVLVVDDLDVEQLSEQQQGERRETYQEFVFAVYFHFWLFSEQSIQAM